MFYASGFGKILFTSDKLFIVKMGEHFKSKFIPLIKSKDEKKYEVEISFKSIIAQTEPGGVIQLRKLDDSGISISLRELKPPKTRDQENTLRGIERFIAWAFSGSKPSDEEVDEVHEAIIEAAMPLVRNRYNGAMYHKRTSDATTVEMSRCIEYALNQLATMDIPDEIVTALGGDMKALWEAWYKWRYDQETDPLYDDEMAMDWESYCGIHPVCELCGQPEYPNDPLERMHIISAGANGTIYELPWNWLRAHASHHIPVQHQKGWDPILEEFPHISGKIRRAKTLEQRSYHA